MPYIFKRITDDELTEVQKKNNKIIRNFITTKVNEIGIKNSKQSEEGIAFYTLQDLLKVSQEAYSLINTSYQQNKIDKNEISRLGEEVSKYINDLKKGATNPLDLELKKYSPDEKQDENLYKIRDLWEKQIYKFIKEKKEELIKNLIDITKPIEERQDLLNDFKDVCLREIDKYKDKLTTPAFQKSYSPDAIKKVFEILLMNKQQSITTEYEKLKKEYLNEKSPTKILNAYIEKFLNVSKKIINQLSNELENKLGNDDTFKETFEKLINKEKYKKLKEEWKNKIIEEINNVANSEEILKNALKSINQNEEKRNELIDKIKLNIDEKLKVIRDKDIWYKLYQKQKDKEKRGIKSTYSKEPIGENEEIFYYNGNKMENGVYSENDPALIKYIKSNYSFNKVEILVNDLYGKYKKQFISNRKSKPQTEKLYVYETKINGENYYIDSALKSGNAFKNKFLEKDKDFTAYDNIEKYKNKDPKEDKDK